MMRILWVMVAVLAVSACGFQPRGRLAVAEQLGAVEVVTVDPYSELGQGLTAALSRAGVPVPVAGQPAAQLRVLSERLVTAPLTLDQGAFVREYVTRYRVEFRVDGSDGKVRLPAQQIELSRDYTFDSFASAGSELRRDMADAILRQLDVALRHQP
jgi:LPS-assembly lipoprotein